MQFQDGYGPPWVEDSSGNKYHKADPIGDLTKKVERILSEMKEVEKRLNHIDQQIGFIREEMSK